MSKKIEKNKLDKIDLDIKITTLITLVCVYIMPTGLLKLDSSIPKLFFISGLGLIYLFNIFKEKKINFWHIIFIGILLALTILSRNINFLTFFPLIMLDRVIEKKDVIINYLKKSNILYICLICTIIYTFFFLGYNNRFAFSSIKEINQSGLALFCLAMLFMKKDKKIGYWILIFGLLTFSRSYYLAFGLFLLSNIKFIKDKLLRPKLIKFCNYFNLTIISSVVLILLGIFYIYQFRNGNILSDSEINNRLLQFFDYSNYFRFSAVIIVLLIFKKFPKKIFLGMSNNDYKLFGKTIASKMELPFRGIVPHNLMFSHLKIYGLFAIFEIYYISKRISKVVNKENFFIYLAIAAYSIILGAGFYSYWLYLSIIMFIMFGLSGGLKNE